MQLSDVMRAQALRSNLDLEPHPIGSGRCRKKRMSRVRCLPRWRETRRTISPPFSQHGGNGLAVALKHTARDGSTRFRVAPVKFGCRGFRGGLMAGASDWFRRFSHPEPIKYPSDRHTYRA
jgi:hypothetical protein